MMQSTNETTMAVIPVPAMFGLSDRNARAQKVIFDFAAGHAAADIGVGLAGLIVPGGSTAALIGSVLGQAPLVYTPMSQKLAQIYGTQANATSGRVVFAGALTGGGLDIAATIGADFLAEIAHEILSEAGLAVGASAIPFLGPLVGAFLDAAIAATMTWRIGTMVSIYFQNGAQWVGNRKSTYELARELAGSISTRNENRVILDDVSSHVPDVKKRMVAYAVDLITTMTETGVHVTAIRSALTKKGVPIWIIDEALNALG